MSQHMQDNSREWREPSFAYDAKYNHADTTAAAAAASNGHMDDDYYSVWTNEEQEVEHRPAETFPGPSRHKDPRNGGLYTTESAPSANVSQLESHLKEKAEDLTVSDFNVAQGVFKKRGRSLKFTIDEFYDSCFSITFLVPETGQKWVVFIPPPEDILLLRRLWGSAKSADNHEKICAWLLESVVLEFSGSSIKHAQFDFAALHDACLSELEGYVHSGSPYKQGIGKDIIQEIREREKVRGGVKNAKQRATANHKEFKEHRQAQADAQARGLSQHNFLQQPSMYQQQQHSRQQYQQQQQQQQAREMISATPPLRPGVQDPQGLFTTPAPEAEEDEWAAGHSQQHRHQAESSVIPKSIPMSQKLLAKMGNLPPELQHSPYMPLTSKPSGSAAGRAKHRGNSRKLKRMKLRAQAGEELDAIQESVYTVLSEVQGRLDRLRECVVATAASTAPSTAGVLGSGLEGTEPGGDRNMFDLSSPPTSDLPPRYSDGGVMTIHEADEGEMSPDLRDSSKQGTSLPFNGRQAAPPPRMPPSGVFKRKDISIASDAPSARNKYVDAGNTPRPVDQKPEFKIPPVQYSKTSTYSHHSGRQDAPNSVSGMVNLEESRAASRGRRRRSISSDKADHRSSSQDGSRSRSSSPSKYKVKPPSKTSDSTSAKNNQQSDVLASVLAKMAVLEKEVAEQKKVNMKLKESMLEEIVKARKEAIDDIVKAQGSVIQGNAIESSMSLYGSTEDVNTFDTSVVVEPIAYDDKSYPAQSYGNKQAGSPSSLKNLRGRSQLIVTNTVKAMSELQEAFWKAISKKDAPKVMVCLQELNIVFPGQPDLALALQNLATPFSTCIRTFHKMNQGIFMSCLEFIQRACSDGSFVGSGGSVVSVSSNYISPECVKFQGIFGDSGFCSLLVDIIGAHCEDSSECMAVMKTILALTSGNSENRARFGKQKFCDSLNAIADEYLMDEKMLSFWARLVAELTTRSTGNQDLFASNGISEKLGLCIKAHSNHSKVMMNLCKAAALLCSGGHKENQNSLGSKDNCDFYVSILKSRYFSAVVVESMLVIILGAIENNETVLANFGESEIAPTLCDMLSSESLGPSVHKLTLWFTSLLCRDNVILQEMQGSTMLRDCLLKMSTGAFTEELQKLATVCVRRLTPVSRSGTASQDASRGVSRGEPSRGASRKSGGYPSIKSAGADSDAPEQINYVQKPSSTTRVSSADRGSARSRSHSPEQRQRSASLTEVVEYYAANDDMATVSVPRISSSEKKMSPSGVNSSAHRVDSADNRPVSKSADPITFEGGRMRSADKSPDVIPGDVSTATFHRSASREKPAPIDVSPTGSPANEARRRTPTAGARPQSSERVAPRSALQQQISGTPDVAPTSRSGSPGKPTPIDVAPTGSPANEARRTAGARPQSSERVAPRSAQQRDASPTSASKRLAADPVPRSPSREQPRSAVAPASASAQRVFSPEIVAHPMSAHESEAVSATQRDATPKSRVSNTSKPATADHFPAPNDTKTVISAGPTTAEENESHRPFSKDEQPFSSSKKQRPTSGNTAHANKVSSAESNNGSVATSGTKTYIQSNKIVTAPAVEENINPQDYAEFGFADTASDVPVNEFDSVPIRQVNSRMSGTSADGRRPSTGKAPPLAVAAQRGLEDEFDQPEESNRKKHNRKKSKQQVGSDEGDQGDEEKQKKKKKKKKSTTHIEGKLPPLTESAASPTPQDVSGNHGEATAETVASADPTNNPSMLLGGNSIGEMSQMSMMAPPYSKEVEPMSGGSNELFSRMATACQTNDAVKILEELEKAAGTVLSASDVLGAVSMLAKALVVTMNQFESDSSVTIACMTTAAAVCTPHSGDVDKKHQDIFVSMAFPTIIASALRLHHSEGACCVSLLKIILILCANNLQSRQAFSGVQSVFSGLSVAVDRNTASSAVVTLWARAIAELCDGVPDNQDNFGSAGACSRVMKCLKKHQKNTKVITNLCKACVRLCKNAHLRNQEELSTESGAAIWLNCLKKDGPKPELAESRMRGFFAVVSENELVKTNFRAKGLGDVLSSILADESMPELVHQLVLCVMYDCANDAVLAEEFKANATIASVTDLISSRSNSSANTKKYAALCSQKLFG